MSFTDWDARFLPSAERCLRWFEQGGTWHTASDAPVPAFYMSRGTRERFPSMADQALWRPWKDGNPALWAEFFALTHPPIPKGYKPRGEWVQSPHGTYLALEEGGAYQLEDGLPYEQVNRVSPGEWYRVLEVLPKPVGWGDIPEGVRIHPDHGLGGASNVIELDGKVIGRVFDSPTTDFYTHDKRQHPLPGSPFPTLPAAIVALVKAAEVKS